MKKTFKINDFKTNEIIQTTDKIKGGTSESNNAVNWIITDNINGLGVITESIAGIVIEDNVMV